MGAFIFICSVVALVLYLAWLNDKKYVKWRPEQCIPDTPPPPAKKKATDLILSVYGRNYMFLTAWYAVNGDGSSAFFLQDPHRFNGPVEEWAVDDESDFLFNAEKLTLLKQLIGTDWYDGPVKVTIDIRIADADIEQAKSIGCAHRDMLDKLSNIPD